MPLTLPSFPVTPRDHAWPGGVGVRVRIGLHTGQPQMTDEGYVGLDVHRATRVGSAGHGGQTLLSETARGRVGSRLPAGAAVQALGALVHDDAALVALERILATAQFEIEDQDLVAAALDDYRRSATDFSDCLIGRRHRAAGSWRR